MQEPTSAMVAASAATKPRCSEAPEQPQEQLQCPRCESTNTKFCYYNNYNLAQPRHFCKDCRRYWTKGGSLRNIPVGGGTRRTSKRSTAAASTSNPPKRRLSPSPSSTASSDALISRITKPEPISFPCPPAAADHDDHRLLDFSGSLCSLLGTDGTFAQLLDNCFRPGTTPAARTLVNPAEFPQQQHQQQSSGESNGNESTTKPSVPERFLGFPGDPSCWSTPDGAGAGVWPDLAIYTPLFKFQ